ncbi:MAG: aminomethyl-transferring glycine dehydrogenase subunit GcvPB [Deltaproteobacteria bacterium]|nr:aminomethyl-transferring glycine dehydrogenase subunit GcvPB [Deltaproteobacteria bacterium]
MTRPLVTSGASGLLQEEPLIFERSVPGRRAAWPRPLDVPPADDLDPALLRAVPPRLPEVSEPDVVRHHTRLSQRNYGIDAGFYPLGSCTMKHNPRVSEDLAALPGFGGLHPNQPVSSVQGALRVMVELEDALAEITGLDAVTLQPSAGAHGEFTGLLIVRAAHEARGDARRRILIPESAHGTNPASATLCGYETVEVPAGPDGVMLPESVRSLMAPDVAGLMVTHPNTVGLYETHLREICAVVHDGGGLVYGDGANLNALMGVARPGDVGIDVMHVNLHKTFSTPHGGGGPGAGPVAVRAALAPYLPRPVIQRGERLAIDWDRPLSIGKVRSFYGNFGVLVRAWTYVRQMGGPGLSWASRMAVLNANYLRARLGASYEVAFDRPCMHEVILTDRRQRPHGVETMDIAKALMDHGFHPPTVYFPLVVPHALMVEPTESESLDEMDAFVAAMEAVARQASEDPASLHAAPWRSYRRRLDEVLAAKSPDLRYTWPSPEGSASGGD